ncbi:MAG: ECF-type sigma factor [Planctomycetota bacterium]
MAAPLDTPDPISSWITGLRENDDEAVARLWDHFVGHLHISLRRRIRPTTRALYDEEDAALSAFQSLVDGIQAGRLPDVTDRRSLWRILLVIAARKVVRRHRFDQQIRRDRGRELSLDSAEFRDAFDLGVEPTPENLVALEEAVVELFACLPCDELRRITEMKLEGFTDREVASELRLSPRTIRRKLELIRRAWIKLDPADDGD